LNVVKELIENSIDSDSKLIEIEIKEGGLELIRISDRGKGIN
jgi:DNA mismatch repair ATPase MutL